MALVSDAKILNFLGITANSISISSYNDMLYFKYDAGSSTAVELTDGSYTPDELATHLKARLDTVFTITSTVSYSSTTRKFTITVSAGHTIQYINSGSDAGLTLGFTTNSSAALSITSDSEILQDPSTEALLIRDAVEDMLEKECRRSFISTTYTLEKYNGSGTPYLYLKNYPITNVAQLSIETQDAIWVWNTSDDTLATVSVTSTAVVLNKDGTSDTLLFADYTTLSTMVTAIAAAGNGWQAQISASEFNTYKTTQLVKRYGASAVNDNYVYLQIPNDPQSTFEVYENEGMIVLAGNFPAGANNVFITYTTGYDTIPSDLEYAIKIWTKSLYTKYQQEAWGLDSFKIGDVSYTYNKQFSQYVTSYPAEIRGTIAKYKKRKV